MRRKDPHCPSTGGDADESSDLEAFDTFDEFESSDPTPVGQMRLAKAPAEAAKPGTPRPELLERLGLPSGPSPNAPGIDDGPSLSATASARWLRARWTGRPSPAALLVTGLVVLTLVALVLSMSAD